MFLLSRIRNEVEKDTITEEPISLEARLTICLYRLARGDCCFTIAEVAAIGKRTVGYIVNGDDNRNLGVFMGRYREKHMPKSEEEFTSKILDMEESWQFPQFCWSAVDGCHIPVRWWTGVMLRIP